MELQQMRETLLSRTISIVANNGLNKTTTKAITSGTGINEVYIYRNFSNKEDLLAKAFDKLDGELANVITQSLCAMCMHELNFDLRCKMYFSKVWKFMLTNKEFCLAFVQYYYSLYFPKYSAEAHKKRYEDLVKKLSSVFKDDSDVWMILSYILTSLLDFAVKVHNGQIADSDEYSDLVFCIVYASVKQYVKTPEEISNFISTAE